MEVGIRFLKALNTGIMLLFLGGLLWIYASIERDVVANSGLIDTKGPFTKESFFYVSLMVFAFSNAFMYIATGVLSGSLSKKASVLYFTSYNDKMKLLIWLRVFQVALSLSLFFLMLYFGLGQIADTFFYGTDWLLFACPVLLFASLVYFIHMSMSILLVKN